MAIKDLLTGPKSEKISFAVTPRFEALIKEAAEKENVTPSTLVRTIVETFFLAKERIENEIHQDSNWTRSEETKKS